ncbi:hypothetical protein SAMN05660462_01706 [Proteiniborus ethanoligenes]|uniref:Uncharacterized protein n=1 Tax=Proteiniborus ethanoligenes TaxID=415015 RepID=A0A1H3PZ86_9FIRM|nr:hypothetical protein [Proteiniborus ethanoligenes]SDZ06248.1 hypothetical protein SAMN05660462_01706 [Proteiniborus ethanoligenes]
MKKVNSINKKAIIIFPIILALVLTSLGPLALLDRSNKNEAPESQPENVNIEDLVYDETALKIIDIHKNPENYNEKLETLEVQFFEFEDGYSVGIEYFFEGGDSLLFDLPADFNNANLPDDIQNFDWIEVTGKIKLIKEAHDDHFHPIPIIYISEVKALK